MLLFTVLDLSKSTQSTHTSSYINDKCVEEKTSYFAYEEIRIKAHIVAYQVFNSKRWGKGLRD